MLSNRTYSDKSLESADARAVSDAAQALNIREIDFFRLAYQRWQGVAANDKALETYFVAFMFHGRVPLWARHLARHVLHQQQQGRLDPVALGADQYRKQEKPPPLGRVY
ncbi:MAG: hypothetical protein OEY85_10400, partial [Rhodospirillales bacterium]|nr:hypothetical protein [Rhodospirillales bacterium]